MLLPRQDHRCVTHTTTRTTIENSTKNTNPRMNDTKGSGHGHLATVYKVCVTFPWLILWNGIVCIHPIQETLHWTWKCIRLKQCTRDRSDRRIHEARSIPKHSCVNPSPETETLCDDDGLSVYRMKYGLMKCWWTVCCWDDFNPDKVCKKHRYKSVNF